MWGSSNTPDIETNKGSHSQVQVGDPVNDDLQVIPQSDKNRLYSEIDAKKYVPQKDTYAFRRDMGPKSFAIRMGGCLMLLAFSYFVTGGTPRSREDREWLITFCLVMMVFFGLMHTLSYVQSQMFGSIGQMFDAARGAGAYAIQEFNEM